VLFEQRLREGISAGTITMTFRRWRRSQVVAGGRYRTGVDIIEVDAVDIISADQITPNEARAAGYATPDEARADLRGAADTPVYRIRFRRIDEPDPRATLAADDDLDTTHLAELDRRLARLDTASSHGPWTMETLSAIAANPGTVSTELAKAAGLDRWTFKQDVRKLKELGLTLSLTTGYQLSPRGAAYLRHARGRDSR
jgi:hypothetical protein